MVGVWFVGVFVLIVQLSECGRVAGTPSYSLGREAVVINYWPLGGAPAMEATDRTRRVRFDAFEVDMHSGEVRKHGIRLKLHRQPFQVLTLLLEHPGDLVTRGELRKKLWPGDTFVDFDTGLNSAIKKPRDALCDSAEEPRYIETLPRRGYRFIAPVEKGNLTAPAAVHENLAVVPLPTPLSSTKRWSVLGAAAFVRFLVVAAVSWRVLFARPWLSDLEGCGPQDPHPEASQGGVCEVPLAAGDIPTMPDLRLSSPEFPFWPQKRLPLSAQIQPRNAALGRDFRREIGLPGHRPRLT
jgi:DNA-binding winged helix-turn-helix (wHTH) protein